MSVVLSHRGENKLDVFIKARNLAVYTTKICSNKNKFDVTYYETTQKIVSIAQQIYMDVWSANNIFVNSKLDYMKRHGLQNEAHANCNILLAMIDMAYGLYHLDSKRVKYWANLVIEVRQLISKWKSQDMCRYQKFL